MRKQVVMEIYGKRRIIRDIQEDSETEFLAYYGRSSNREGISYGIHVLIDGDGDCYAWCTHPDGGLIVDGYITDEFRDPGSIEAGIRECLENIFHEELAPPK
jgi:hypothetical protein